MDVEGRATQERLPKEAALAHPCVSQHLYPCALGFFIYFRGFESTNSQIKKAPLSGPLFYLAEREAAPALPCASQHLHIRVHWDSTNLIEGSSPLTFK